MKKEMEEGAARQQTTAESKPRSTRRHVKYPKKLPEYAALFGQTVRTVARWIRRGKEMEDLPPLDKPEQMAGWWRRCMDHQVPDYLIGFLPAVDAVAAPDPAGRSRDFSQIKALDIEQNVEELRRTHAINRQLLDEALLSAEPAAEQTVTLRQRNYERSLSYCARLKRACLESMRCA